MNISELISLLEVALETHGEIDVENANGRLVNVVVDLETPPVVVIS